MSRSRVTDLLMRICACRLDEKVSADDFVDRVNELILMCEQTFGRSEAPEPKEESPAAPTSEDKTPPPMTLTRNPRPAHLHRKRRGHAPKVSHDDKVRIRRLYNEAKAGRQRVPPGWLDAMAAEYGVPVTTIKSIVYFTDGT